MNTKPAASPKPCKNFYEASQRWQGMDAGAKRDWSVPVVAKHVAGQLAGKTVTRTKSVCFLNTIQIIGDNSDSSAQNVALNTAENKAKVDPLESRRTEGLQLSFAYLRRAANDESVSIFAFQQLVTSSVVTRLLKERDVGVYHTLLAQDDEGHAPLTEAQKRMIRQALDQQSKMLAAAQQQRMDDRRKSTEERLQNLWLKSDLNSQSSSESSYSLPATPTSMSPSSSFAGGSLRSALKEATSKDNLLEEPS